VPSEAFMGLTISEFQGAIMKTAKELFQDGKLAAAIERQTLEVKAKPADIAERTFLFELLCFTGGYDRAEKQLEVIGHQSKEMEVGAGIYRQVLTAERARRAVFLEGRNPDFLTTPPDYVPLHLEALALQRENHPEKARALLERALDMHPALPGAADGIPFTEFEDADLFLSPFLELMVNDKYAWLPFEQIRRIEIVKPAQLRDLLWARAKLEARGGDLGEVFLPVLYPGSADNPDDAIRTGRRTDWMEAGAGLMRGAGQRLFAIDGNDKVMLEIAEVSFNSNGDAIST
jgi:type VI secretion system protein ImpE